MATYSQVVSNLPGKILTRPDYFLKVLEEWSTSPASQTMWLVRFEPIGPNPQGAFPTVLYNNIVEKFERTGRFSTSSPPEWSTAVSRPGEGGREGAWNMAGDAHYHSFSNFQRAPGCMLVQGVNIPGENVAHNYVGVENAGGLIPVMHGGERDKFNQVTTQVFESNTSFIDTIIRPWIVLSSHLGLIARDENNPQDWQFNVKCNLDVTLLAKTVGRDVVYRGGTGPNKTILPKPINSDEESGVIQRKRFKFYNAVPVGMDASDLTYNSDQGVNTNNITWMYTHYTVQNLDGGSFDAKDMNILMQSWAEEGLGRHWSNIGYLFGQKELDYERRWSAHVNRSPTTGFGKLKQYGPRAKQFSPTKSQTGKGAGTLQTLAERWKSVPVTNLCGGTGGRPDICKPPPPAPGSALDRLRNGLRNIQKFARGARGAANAFKNFKKAKGVKGKVNALGDLNKSLGRIGISSGKKGARHKTLGGGMPKTKNDPAGGAISKAGGIIDDAKKAARSVTGSKKAGGAH